MDDEDIAAIQQLPEEIRQAAATLMAVSPAAPHGAKAMAQHVSTLYCPYCGDPTQRSHLLEHLESGCSGVAKAVRDTAEKEDEDHHQQQQQQQQQQEKQQTDKRRTTTATSPRSEERRRQRPATSMGYRTPEKSHTLSNNGNVDNVENVRPNNWTGGSVGLPTNHSHTSSPMQEQQQIQQQVDPQQLHEVEEDDSTMQLRPCSHCQRTFATGRLEIHERVCQRIFGEKRHTYDALNKRTHDTPFRPTHAHTCNQCGRDFAHREEMLVHERACGGNRSASRSRRKNTPGRPQSSGGRGGSNQHNDDWGRGSVASSVGGNRGGYADGGSAIKSARRSGGRRGAAPRSSFGSALRGGNSSIMLDTLDENYQSTILDDDYSVDYDPATTVDPALDDDNLSLAGPPSVVRVGEGSLSSIAMSTPSGQYSSSRHKGSAPRSGLRHDRSVRNFIFGYHYFCSVSWLFLLCSVVHR